MMGPVQSGVTLCERWCIMQRHGWVLLCVCGILSLVSSWSSAEVPKAAAELKNRCLEVLRNGIKQTDDFWPSIHAAEGLTQAGHGEEVKAVFGERLKTEKDGNRRIGLAREMYRAGDKDKAAIILDLLSDPVVDVRVHAAESLYKIGAIGDGKLLKEALSQKENASLQMMAAGALAKAGDSQAMAFLRQALSDPANRHYAAWVIGRLGDKSDLPALRELVMTETKPTERSYGEHALACLGDAAGRAALVNNLNSPDVDIRSQAAEHAGINRMTAAVKRLTALLDDPKLDVQLRAAQALLLIGR
jgi:sialidase-1